VKVKVKVKVKGERSTNSQDTIIEHSNRVPVGFDQAWLHEL
jgi:hypothetical protein